VVLSAISSPVRAGATIALAATASDPDGIVQRVDFYAGTLLLGSSSGPSFTLPWLVPAPGDYRLKAVAVDDRNAATHSAAIDVAVVAAGPTLAVSAAAVAPGASITVTLVDGTGAAGDWLAFAPAAAVDSGYLKYTYVGAGVGCMRVTDTRGLPPAEGSPWPLPSRRFRPQVRRPEARRSR
jgi:hypothetical protein